ncbi:hypothetical protein ACFLZG_01680 [Thermodesulfobacteriota bacterium]
MKSCILCTGRGAPRHPDDFSDSESVVVEADGGRVVRKGQGGILSQFPHLVGVELDADTRGTGDKDIRDLRCEGLHVKDKLGGHAGYGLPGLAKQVVHKILLQVQGHVKDAVDIVQLHLDAAFRLVIGRLSVGAAVRLVAGSLGIGVLGASAEIEPCLQDPDSDCNVQTRSRPLDTPPVRIPAGDKGKALQADCRTLKDDRAGAHALIGIGLGILDSEGGGRRIVLSPTGAETAGKKINRYRADREIAVEAVSIGVAS